jgi:hypothetical protein
MSGDHNMHNSDRALMNAIYWHNRCAHLEEIIHQFCMDAEYHNRASDALSGYFRTVPTFPKPEPLTGWKVT